MKTHLAALLLCLLSSGALEAQSWSASVGTGPFVFGDFARRTFTIETEDDRAEHTIDLSAATRPGLTVGIERELNERFAVRVTGTFTRAPLEVAGDDGVELDDVNIDVATIAVPLVVRINTNGTFRFYVFGGPAHAAYRINGNVRNGTGLPLFEGTRNDWGLTAGGGVSWRLSDRISIDGEIDDTVTRSPFRESDLPGGGSGLEIPRPHNVHTTVNLRWRF